MKRIFIGSSSEALRYAEQVRDLLNAQCNVDVLLWTKLFEPGTLTFEAIERASRRVMGAVLIATPDDDAMIRESIVKVPRTNVMIELGYFTAILGRQNIALCKYDATELATDLKGFTYIGMGPYECSAESQTINTSAAEQLVSWSQSLPELAEGVPHGQVVHGYSGRWKINNRFNVWRRIAIKPPDYVDFEGVLDLHVPTTGVNGYGFLHGTLFVHLVDCYAQVSFSANVENAYCDGNGTLHFTSQMHSRQIASIEGTPPQADGFQGAIHGPQHGTWSLKRSNRKGKLIGRFELRAGEQVSDRARAELAKL